MVPGKRALVCPALDCWPEPHSEELTTSQGSPEPLREPGGGQWARREVQGKEMGKRLGIKGEREQRITYLVSGQGSEMAYASQCSR